MTTLEEDQRSNHERFRDRVAEQDLSRKLHDLGDELRKGVPRAEWVGLRGRYAKGAITCTGGFTGAGKTPLTLGECRAILAREPFLGFSYTPFSINDDFRVVYLTQEAEATFLPSVARAGITAELADGRMEVGYFHDFATDDWERLVADMTTRLNGNGLLIVDTAADWSRVRDENDNAAFAEALRPLQVAVGTGIAVGFIAHTVKNFVATKDTDSSHTHIRGGGSIIANASLVFTYKVAVPKLTGEPRHLQLHRSRLDYNDMKTTRYVLERDGRLERVEPVDHWLRLIGKSAERLFNLLMECGNRLTWSEARDKLEMSATTLDSAVERLNHEDGPWKIDVSGRGVRGDPKLLELMDQPIEDTP